MKTKKLSLALLTAIAAITFALAGLFAFGTQNSVSVKAEDSPVITLGTGGAGGWASANENMSVKFGNVTWTGELASGGEYKGNIYSVEDGTRYTSLSDSSDPTPVYFVPTASGDNGNFVFYLKNVVTAETSDNIKYFLIKKTEPFTRAGVSCYFDNDYVVSCRWGSAPSAVTVLEITLGTGRYATDSLKTVSVNKATWSGTFSGTYTGNIYSTDGEKLSAANILSQKDKGSGVDANLVFNLINVAGIENHSKFIVKENSVFTITNTNDVVTAALKMDKDYFVGFPNWTSNPPVNVIALNDAIQLTLGAGRYASGTGNTVSFNKSAWEGTLQKDTYYGIAYNADGTKLSGNYNFSVTNTTGQEGNTNFAGIDTAITRIVVKKDEVFYNASGNTIFFFDKDYIIIYDWNGTPGVTPLSDVVNVTLGAGNWSTTKDNDNP
ncbi:MAG: hypothetical protein SOT08_04035, partial [Candidatus Borkfalkiaceae bacterium]|nr:hypothetical protein [Christensenellaceae bacterium]